jgi:glutamate 5-kinase
VATAQVLLTFFDICGGRGHYLNARRTLERLLEWQVVPVINENDTTTTDEISFGDNDFLAAQVAILLGAELLMLLTVAGGVYTADPRSDPEARLVAVVDDIEELRALEIGHQTSPLGSGGMRSKVVAAEMATAAGIETVIAGGLEPGVITAAAAGEPVGTRLRAHGGRDSSFKLWLRYAKPSRGRVSVDDGAARALSVGGTSLLPVGVCEVSGEFDAGDAVEVTHGAAVIGKGISSYSAAELAQVAGLKSAAVRARLPDSPDEAIHRDYFVLV